MKLLTILLISISAYAGSEVGNGGNGVVCRDSSSNIIGTIQLLDYYEGKFRGLEPNLGDETASVESKIETIWSRLSKRSPMRAKEYRKWTKDFLKNLGTPDSTEVMMLPNIELQGSNDSHHLAFPAGCKVEQIVTQKEPEFPGDRRFIVNQNLWDKMDNTSKAGLIVHEMLLRELIGDHQMLDTKNEVFSSKGARFFNQVLAADRLPTSVNAFKKLSQLSDYDFILLLKLGGFYDFEAAGFWFEIDDTKNPENYFYENGQFKGTTDVSFNPTPNQKYNGHVFDGIQELVIDPNGQLLRIKTINVENRINGMRVDGGEFFFSGGKIVKAKINWPTELKTSPSTTFKFPPERPVYFDSEEFALIP